MDDESSVVAVVVERDGECYGAVRHQEGHVNGAAAESTAATLRALAAIAEGSD